MSERKAFLLRVDPALLEALQRWANDDLRSLNAQIEFVLRRSIQREGRAIRATQTDEPHPTQSREISDPTDISPPARD